MKAPKGNPLYKMSCGCEWPGPHAKLYRWNAKECRCFATCLKREHYGAHIVAIDKDCKGCGKRFTIERDGDVVTAAIRHCPACRKKVEKKPEGDAKLPMCSVPGCRERRRDGGKFTRYCQHHYIKLANYGCYAHDVVYSNPQGHSQSPGLASNFLRAVLGGR